MNLERDTSQRLREYYQRLLQIRFLSLSIEIDDSEINRSYTGNGTNQDPYLVENLQNDRHSALNFPKRKKYTIAVLHAMSFFALTFGSSVYASSIPDVMQRFAVSEEVATLGLALYVLGFAVGPILWAPMSEVYGRRPTFVISYTLYIAFTVAAPCAPNITALLVLRFLASAFGSSAQTNPAGMISDMFSKEERGLVAGFFAACPFLGPALGMSEGIRYRLARLLTLFVLQGPIVGGYVNEAQGWRWTLGVNAVLSGAIWILGMLATTETYAPVILRSRARTLSQMTGHVYISQLEAAKATRTLSKELSVSLTRPWILLFCEPIVLLTGLYISIIYATLYMFFAAIPIVFEGSRGWDQGSAGLPFIGVAVGVCLAVFAAAANNKSYVRSAAAVLATGKSIEPETRLHNAMWGSVILPIGLFLFAWTTYASVHWIAPIIGATLFSCGLVMVFISLISYLIDTCKSEKSAAPAAIFYIQKSIRYTNPHPDTIYVASALAANTILRSLFAAAFPLFTAQMYAGLGDQWASSIPAFLAVGCLPFPFMFYRYGSKIRSRCKYALEAANAMEMILRRHAAVDHDGQHTWRRDAT